MGTNDKNVFFSFQLNGLLSGHKGTQKFLKAVLLPMYGFAYPPYFGNARRSEVMIQFVSSKVINNDNTANFSDFLWGSSYFDI